ncbi:MAG: hypothetical protein HQK49_17575 [Oligoflexia bacterium]|nr:hypothetical protein [Oligoflexia bacterium]
MNISKSIFSVIIFLLITSNAYSMAAWDRANKPELMLQDYNSTFSELPTSGQLTTMPWSDDYWPTYKGGITFRWNQSGSSEEKKYGYSLLKEGKIRKGMNTQNLSPAEKYDLYLGRYDFPLTTQERERTEIMKTVRDSDEYDRDFSIPRWEGLCHAWAPATMQFNNPAAVKVVNKDGIAIEFGSSDIKALLTYFLHSTDSQTYTIGSRCNLDFKELKEKVEAGEMSEEKMNELMNAPKCKDTNAGAFHVALVNQIALNDEGFVADVTRDAEVWNQPVYGFKTTIISEEDGASDDAAEGTVKEITVETEMLYIAEVAQTWEKDENHKGLGKKVYRYKLEINKKGRIIGGEWLQEERPDFIWKQTKPAFSGFFGPLKSIYEKSIK